MKATMPPKDAIGVLPAIPGHAHIIGTDGLPTCGCAYRFGDVIVRGTLSVEREVREKPYSVHDVHPWVEREPTGRTFGTLEAEIHNPTKDYSALLGKRSVFQWPDKAMFLLVIVNRVEYVPSMAGHIVVRTRSTVLRIAEYGGNRPLNESAAGLQLAAHVADPPA